jgi:6-phosphogluconolactonase
MGMSAEPEVHIEPAAEELADRTADRTVSVLGAAVQQTGAAHLVLTGGGILEKVLVALGRRGPALDWPRVHVWWGDERYVPADSDERNDLPAMRLLFDLVDVDPAKLHRMPAADAGFGEDVESAAESYAAELAHAVPGADDGAVPAFDAVLLGVGPDGHCASLFPGHPGTRVVDTSVIAVRNSPKPPPTRLSLTFPALDAAKEVWFIASGSGKADAVARALSGAPREEVPSAGPRGRNRTLWLIDREAAAQLQS